LIKKADFILKGIGSAISLSSGSATMPIPDHLGSPLHQIEVTFKNGEWDDCGRMARDIIGRSGKDDPAKAIVSPGGFPASIPAIKFGTQSPQEQLALTIAMDEATKDPALKTDEAKKAAGQKVADDYRDSWSKSEPWVRATSTKRIDPTA